MRCFDQSFQRLAVRDAKLGLDQVDARNLLGHSMFDLDAGIALDEKMFAALRIHEEFDRARVHIASGAHEADGVFKDASSKSVLQSRRRRDLHHLLVSNLD
jgi:hypothetical protein